MTVNSALATRLGIADMARNFLGIPGKPYIGVPFALPAHVQNTKFGNQPPLPPTTVAAQIDWITYGVSTVNPNMAVGINLGINQGGSPRQVIDKILSVRIDNLGNPVPIYVYFPDTNYTIVAKPNSVVWEPVETGQFNAVIIGEGFSTGQVGKTNVYFCNFAAIPFSDDEFPQAAALWLASASITRGGTIFNQNFGIPALGDQTVQYSGFYNSAGIVANNIWGTPLSSGFIYLTHVDFSLIDSAITAASGSSIVLIESTGTAGILYSLPEVQAGTANQINNQIQKLVQFSGMNIKLDATQTWRVRVASCIQFQANWSFISNFTVNPQ